MRNNPLSAKPSIQTSRVPKTVPSSSALDLFTREVEASHRDIRAVFSQGHQEDTRLNAAFSGSIYNALGIPTALVRKVSSVHPLPDFGKPLKKHHANHQGSSDSVIGAASKVTKQSSSAWNQAESSLGGSAVGAVAFGRQHQPRAFSSQTFSLQLEQRVSFTTTENQKSTKASSHLKRYKSRQAKSPKKLLRRPPLKVPVKAFFGKRNKVIAVLVAMTTILACLTAILGGLLISRPTVASTSSTEKTSDGSFSSALPTTNAPISSNGANLGIYLNKK